MQHVFHKHDKSFKLYCTLDMYFKISSTSEKISISNYLQYKRSNMEMYRIFNKPNTGLAKILT